jgi:chromosome segregation ATPase
MASTLSTDGDVLRDSFRAWHSEREAIDGQLSESLEALTAYQTHLDEWQQKLADERATVQTASDQLQLDREELEAARAEFQEAQASGSVVHEEIENERAALEATREELDRTFDQLQTAHEAIERDRDELRAAREQLELDRELLDIKCAELEQHRADVLAVQAEVEAASAELAAARSQFENDRDNTQCVIVELEQQRSELLTSKDQLETSWNELRTARGMIEQEREELRAEHNQLERDRAEVEKGHVEASATLTAELNAARDKISALTSNLLGRTDELRTLDNRRAEAATEAELAHAREKELKAALDDHKRTAEQERQHWKEELRQLRELLQRRVENHSVDDHARAGAANHATPAPPVHPAPIAPTVRSASTSSGAHVIPRENPVLGSIVQQFDKLRQQRASDRSGNKSK